jgi:hypothetical protein
MNTNQTNKSYDHFAKMQKLHPKKRRVLALCDKYQENQNPVNALIKEFTAKLKTALIARKSCSSAAPMRADIFVYPYEVKHHRDTTDVFNMRADVHANEQMFISQYFINASLEDLLNPSVDQARTRQTIDQVNEKANRLEHSSEILSGQLEQFYKWIETPEYRRLIDNYNWISKKILRERRKSENVQRHHLVLQVD